MSAEERKRVGSANRHPGCSGSGEKGIQLEWIGTCRVNHFTIGDRIVDILIYVIRQVQQRISVRYVLMASCKSRPDGTRRGHARCGSAEYCTELLQGGINLIHSGYLSDI